MSDDFATYIANERAKIAASRRAIDEQMSVLKSVIAGLDREELAIAAYESAKTGKSTPAAGLRTRARGSRSGSRRAEIISAIKSAPQGMSRGELLLHFGVRGDKNAEMSVSNALTALKKAGQITRRLDGKYVVDAAPGMKEAAE